MQDFTGWTPERLIARYKEVLKRRRILLEEQERRREYLIRTFSPYILATRFGIVMAQASELHRLEQHLARIEEKLPSTPEPNEVKFTDKEEHILEALGAECLTGEEIARRAGWTYNSNFKITLSNLCKRGILENSRPGYRRRRSRTSRAE